MTDRSKSTPGRRVHFRSEPDASSSVRSDESRHLVIVLKRAENGAHVTVEKVAFPRWRPTGNCLPTQLAVEPSQGNVCVKQLCQLCIKLIINCNLVRRLLDIF